MECSYCGYKFDGNYDQCPKCGHSFGLSKDVDYDTKLDRISTGVATGIFGTGIAGAAIPDKAKASENEPIIDSQNNYEQQSSTDVSNAVESQSNISTSSDGVSIQSSAESNHTYNDFIDISESSNGMESISSVESGANTNIDSNISVSDVETSISENISNSTNNDINNYINSSSNEANNTEDFGAFLEENDDLYDDTFVDTYELTNDTNSGNVGDDIDFTTLSNDLTDEEASELLESLGLSNNQSQTDTQRNPKITREQLSSIFNSLPDEVENEDGTVTSYKDYKEYFLGLINTIPEDKDGYLIFREDMFDLEKFEIKYVCPNCGTLLNNNPPFCPVCGKESFTMEEIQDNKIYIYEDGTQYYSLLSIFLSHPECYIIPESELDNNSLGDEEQQKQKANASGGGRIDIDNDSLVKAILLLRGSQTYGQSTDGWGYIVNAINKITIKQTLPSKAAFNSAKSTLNDLFGSSGDGGFMAKLSSQLEGLSSNLQQMDEEYAYLYNLYADNFLPMFGEGLTAEEMFAQSNQFASEVERTRDAAFEGMDAEKQQEYRRTEFSNGQQRYKLQEFVVSGIAERLWAGEEVSPEEKALYDEIISDIQTTIHYEGESELTDIERYINYYRTAMSASALTERYEASFNAAQSDYEAAVAARDAFLEEHPWAKTFHADELAQYDQAVADAEARRNAAQSRFEFQQYRSDEQQMIILSFTPEAERDDAWYDNFYSCAVRRASYDQSQANNRIDEINEEINDLNRRENSIDMSLLSLRMAQGECEYGSDSYNLYQAQIDALNEEKAGLESQATALGEELGLQRSIVYAREFEICSYDMNRPDYSSNLETTIVSYASDFDSSCAGSSGTSTTNFTFYDSEGRVVNDPDQIALFIMRQDKSNEYWFGDGTWSYSNINSNVQDYIRQFGAVSRNPALADMEDFDTSTAVDLTCFAFNYYDDDKGTSRFAMFNDFGAQALGYEAAQANLARIADKEGFDRWLATGGQGILDGIDTWGEGIRNLFFADGRATAQDYEYQYYLQALDSGSARAYQLGSSFGNMLPTILVNAAIGIATGGAGLAALGLEGFAATATGLAINFTTMGLSVMGNKKEQLMQQGVDSGTASLIGFLNGLSETALESFLGTIPGVRLLDNFAGLRGIRGYLAKILSEGIEESVQEYIEPYITALFTGQDLRTVRINWDQVKEAGIDGMIMSAILNFGSLSIDAASLAFTGSIDTYAAVISQYQGQNFFDSTIEGKSTLANLMSDLRNVSGLDYNLDMAKAALINNPDIRAAYDAEVEQIKAEDSNAKIMEFEDYVNNLAIRQVINEARARNAIGKDALKQMSQRQGNMIEIDKLTAEIARLYAQLGMDTEGNVVDAEVKNSLTEIEQLEVFKNIESAKAKISELSSEVKTTENLLFDNYLDLARQLNELASGIQDGTIENNTTNASKLAELESMLSVYKTYIGDIIIKESNKSLSLEELNDRLVSLESQKTTLEGKIQELQEKIKNASKSESEALERELSKYENNLRLLNNSIESTKTSLTEAVETRIKELQAENEFLTEQMKYRQSELKELEARLEILEKQAKNLENKDNNKFNKKAEEIKNQRTKIANKMLEITKAQALIEANSGLIEQLQSGSYLLEYNVSDVVDTTEVEETTVTTETLEEINFQIEGLELTLNEILGFIGEDISTLISAVGSRFNDLAKNLFKNMNNFTVEQINNLQTKLNELNNKINSLKSKYSVKKMLSNIKTLISNMNVFKQIKTAQSTTGTAKLFSYSDVVAFVNNKSIFVPDDSARIRMVRDAYNRAVGSNEAMNALNIRLMTDLEIINSSKYSDPNNPIIKQALADISDIMSRFGVGGPYSDSYIAEWAGEQINSFLMGQSAKVETINGVKYTDYGKSGKIFAAKKAIKQALAALPANFVSLLNEVNIFETGNPYDAYWRVERQWLSKFKSAATGGGGVLNVWNGNQLNVLYVAHEIAHSLDTTLNKAISFYNGFWTEDAGYWNQAMVSDGGDYNGYVSDYADESKSNSEDFADAVALYFTDYNNFKARYPNRCAIIEEILKHLYTNGTVDTSALSTGLANLTVNW